MNTNELDVLQLLIQNKKWMDLKCLGEAGISLYAIPKLLQSFDQWYSFLGFQSEKQANKGISFAILSFFLYKRFKMRVDLSEIKNMILKSDTFDKCQCFYDMYLENIAFYLKSLGFSSSMEAIHFICFAMKQGFFSIQNMYQNCEFKFDPIVLSELYGPRVLSGYGVCRNSSAFYRDVLDAIGYDVCCLTGDTISEEALHFFYQFRFTHAVLGVMDGEYKYAYDSMTQEFLTKTNQYQLREGEILKYLSDQMLFLYPFQKKSEVFYKDYKSVAFSTYEGKELREPEIAKSFQDAAAKFMLEKKKLKELKAENFPYMQEIARLESLLAPHGNRSLKRI